MRRQLKFGVLAICLVALGCSTNGGRRPQAVGGSSAVEDRFGVLAPEQAALVDANCYDGLPVDSREAPGSTELVVRRGYVLEHSSVDKIPLWVCESVSVDQLEGHIARSNRFMADPDLRGPKAYPEDYARSGYDRGHQAPAGNQTVDVDLKEQTFFMSNMAPQRPTLNRGIWKVLEEKTRAWVHRYGHAYEWTGPIRCEPEPLHPADSGPCRKTIGKHEVAVPLYFYKIILVQGQSRWKSIAFVLPNTDFKAPYHLGSYITSISSIEERTGLKFMPKMDAKERRALKSTIAAMWP